MTESDNPPESEVPPLSAETVAAIRAAHVPRVIGYKTLVQRFPGVSYYQIRRVLRNQGIYETPDYERPKIAPSSGAAEKVVFSGEAIGNQAWYFHRRLLQRYGIVLAFGEYAAIFTQIKEKRAPVVRQRFDGTVYAIKLSAYPLGPIFVVADNLTGAPVTTHDRDGYFLCDGKWRKDLVRPYDQPRRQQLLAFTKRLRNQQRQP